jgi:hypothetical protein
VRRLLVAGVLVAMMTATTLPAAASTTARTAGPCALLRKREIAQVFLSEVGARTKTQPGPTCRWQVNGGPSVAGGGEVVTVIDRGKSVATAFELAAEFDGGTVEPIEGVGMHAEYLPTLDALFVLVDKKTLLSIQSVFPAQPSTTTSLGTRAPVSGVSHRDQLVALARLAVARV